MKKVINKTKKKVAPKKDEDLRLVRDIQKDKQDSFRKEYEALVRKYGFNACRLLSTKMNNDEMEKRRKQKEVLELKQRIKELNSQ